MAWFSIEHKIHGSAQFSDRRPQTQTLFWPAQTKNQSENWGSDQIQTNQ